MEWQKILETGVAAVIPFSEKLLNLPIFFKNWKDTYTVIASIAAAAIYGYIRFIDPNSLFIPLGSWWIFISIGVLLLIGYIWFFTENNQKIESTLRQSKKSKILMKGMILFMAMYLFLTSGFSLFFQTLEHKLVEFKVTSDDVTPKPIPDATIVLVFKDTAKKETDQPGDDPYEFKEIGLNEKTNANGYVKRYFENSQLKKLTNYKVWTPSHSKYNPVSEDLNYENTKTRIVITMQKSNE